MENQPQAEVLKDLSILGVTVRGAIKQLESFPAPEDVTEVTFETDEVTSLCPKTGQPDYYHLEITYAPSGRCLESKSLKLYLWTFRNGGHFCEQLSQIIVSDIFESISPLWIRVILKMAARGGITIQSIAEKGGIKCQKQ